MQNVASKISSICEIFCYASWGIGWWGVVVVGGYL